MKTATESTVQSLLTNKAQQVDLLRRLDFFLPRESAQIMTSQFLHEVFIGQVFLPRQSEVHPVQRTKLPPKKDCLNILIDILKTHVDHQQHGEAVRRLGSYLVQKETDKYFCVVLIRFFDAQNALFEPSYQPPKKQQVHKAETAAETEKVMELYSKALAGLPTLNGSTGKKRKLNFFSSLANQKPSLSQTGKLQRELHEKQQKANGFGLGPGSSEAQPIQIPDSIANPDGFSQENKENNHQAPNVIGNLHEEQDGLEVMEKLHNIETLCLDDAMDNCRGDSLMNGAEEKQINTSSIVPRRKRK